MLGFASAGETKCSWASFLWETSSLHRGRGVSLEREGTWRSETERGEMFESEEILALHL